MTEGKKQELAARIMAEVQPEIDRLVEERDKALARAGRLAHLLALVEDDISDAHTLGLVRAELGADPAQDKPGMRMQSTQCRKCLSYDGCTRPELSMAMHHCGAFELAQDDGACDWWPDDPDAAAEGSYVQWDASCNFGITFEDGTIPREYIFCPKCGKRIKDTTKSRIEEASKP